MTRPLPLAALALVLAGCADKQETGAAADSAPPEAPQTCEPLSMELAQSWNQEDLPAREELAGGWPGIGIGDLNGDGWLDALLAYPGGSAVLRNDGAGKLAFDDSFTADGEPLPRARAAALADLDGDGDLDGYLGFEADRADWILWNQDNTFTSQEIPGSEHVTWSGSFGDLDGDADLDLFIATYDVPFDIQLLTSGDYLGAGHSAYLQSDERIFERADGSVPADADGAVSLQGALIDADDDGDLDVYMANDFGPYIVSNKLLINDGSGRFSSSSTCHCDVEMYAMGAGVGDADQDGDPDLYISNIGAPRLLLNLGDGTFADGTLSSGAWIEPTSQHMTSWGNQFVDLDQDRCMDIAIVYGQLGDAATGYVPNLEDAEGDWTDGPEQPDVLLQGDCAGGFTELSGAGFDDAGRARAVAVGDIDRDGRPDLLVVGKHFLRYWRAAGGCPPGATVRLRDASGNREGIGSRVQASAGGVTTTQWMLPSTTAGSSATELYFGSGGYDRIDRIAVTWPDGEVSVVEDVPAGSDLTIER